MSGVLGAKQVFASAAYRIIVVPLVPVVVGIAGGVAVVPVVLVAVGIIVALLVLTRLGLVKAAVGGCRCRRSAG